MYPCVVLMTLTEQYVINQNRDLLFNLIQFKLYTNVNGNLIKKNKHNTFFLFLKI